MPKLLVVYDSQTGNTEKMAKAMAEGAKSVPSVEVVLEHYVRPEELEEASAIIFDSPTYHHDMTLTMKHISELLKNKSGMRTIGSGLTTLCAPDNNGLERRRNLGKTVAEKIVNT